jgi:hypothetical protein
MLKINIFFVTVIFVIFCWVFVQKLKENPTKKTSSSTSEISEIKESQKMVKETAQSSSSTEEPLPSIPQELSETLSTSPKTTEIPEKFLKYPYTSKILQKIEEKQKDFFQYLKNPPHEKENKEEYFFYVLSLSTPLYTLLTAEENMKTLDSQGKLLLHERISTLNEEYRKLLEDFKADRISKESIVEHSLKMMADTHEFKNKLTKDQKEEFNKNFRNY